MIKFQCEGVHNMTKELTQSITAYRCRICKKYGVDDLLKYSEENKEPINLEKLFIEFFEHIKRCKIDGYTRRAIMLSKSINKEILGCGVTRFHIQPNSGKSFENFSVVNHKTNIVNSFKGEENSAVYNHNILLYIGNGTNTLVFHRYGQSGCKTAFLNIFNNFLSNKGLIAHFDILLSDEMFDDRNKYIPEKISLITTYSDNYSDKSDNAKEKPRKKIEQETIISLNAPRAQGIKNWFRNLTRKEPSIDELKEVLIKDAFPSEFEDAKLTLKFGKVRRRISLREFSGLIAEYDITEKLELHADGSVSETSIREISDKYALSFMQQEGG